MEPIAGSSNVEASRDRETTVPTRSRKRKRSKDTIMDLKTTAAVNGFNVIRNLGPNAEELNKTIHAHDIPIIEEVDTESLLSVFFKRIAKDKTLDGDALQALLVEGIQEVVNDGKVQENLKIYKESGNKDKGREEGCYAPFITLCNEVLEKVRDASVKTKLDVALWGGDAKPIQFLHYAKIFLARDWISKESRTGRLDLAPSKLDIIVVHEDSESIRQYKYDQEQAKSGTFDPSEPPISNHPGTTGPPTYRIRLSDILCCGEVKWDRAPSRGSKRAIIREELPSDSEGRSDEGNPPHKFRRILTSSQGVSSSERSTMHQSQLVRYAGEMLSRGPYATHALGMTLDYDELQILWFDRQNAIATRKFNLFENPELFVCFLVAFSRFSLDDWGIEERFYRPGGQIKTIIGGTHTVQINTTLEPLCYRMTLLGRGTMVLQGDLILDHSTKQVAIKFYYPEEQRVPEQEFIQRGYEHDNGEIQDYLPLVYASEDPSYTTRTIRQQLGLEEKGQSRQRRITVFEKLESITLLNSTEFASAWRDCVVVHRIMWNMKLEHGDIGIANLMYRRKGSRGVSGVLIDWDLATMRGEEEGMVFGGGTQCTGTIPFAALELVKSKPSRRKYRHDAESMGWTLRFGCINLDHPDNTPLIRPWLHGKSTVGARSASLLGEAGRYKIRPGFEKLFQISGALLSNLLPSPAGRSLDLHFSPAPSHTGKVTDLFQRNVVLGPPLQDEQVEPDEKESWGICWKALEMILDK